MPQAKVNTWIPVDSDGNAGADTLDIELEYATFGDKAHDALVLCNGLNMQYVLWGAEFCEALAARGFYVIAFDSRDCRQSTVIEAAGDPPLVKVYAEKQLGILLERKDGIPYFLADMAKDVLGLLDALEVKAAHIVGFSMGGAVAQNVALMAPERTKSLTLISCGTAEWGMPAPDKEAQAAFIEVDEGADPVETIMKTAKVVMSAKGYDEERIAAVAKLVVERGVAGGNAVKRLLCAQMCDLPRHEALQAWSAAMARGKACERGQLSGELTEAKNIETPDKTYTVFVTEVKREGDESVTTTEKRYSEYFTLKEQLEARWPMVAGVDFPPKSTFGRFGSSIIKDRIEGITKWLNVLLTTPGVKDCYDLCSFLGVESGVAAPVTVISGTADRLVPAEHGVAVARAIVGSQLISVPDMGHEVFGFAKEFWGPLHDGIKLAADRAAE